MLEFDKVNTDNQWPEKSDNFYSKPTCFPDTRENIVSANLYHKCAVVKWKMTFSLQRELFGSASVVSANISDIFVRFTWIYPAENA